LNISHETRCACISFPFCQYRPYPFVAIEPVQTRHIQPSWGTGAVFDQNRDVSEVRDSGPSLGEDGRGVGVDLGEGDGPPSGTLQPNVQAACPGEKRGMG
jgi:hypothetical protein